MKIPFYTTTIEIFQYEIVPMKFVAEYFGIEFGSLYAKICKPYADIYKMNIIRD